VLDQLDARNGDLLLISIISTCFGHLYAHRQENRLRSTACGCLSCCSCCDAGELGGELCAVWRMLPSVCQDVDWLGGHGLIGRTWT